MYYNTVATNGKTLLNKINKSERLRVESSEINRNNTNKERKHLLNLNPYHVQSSWHKFGRIVAILHAIESGRPRATINHRC